MLDVSYELAFLDGLDALFQMLAFLGDVLAHEAPRQQADGTVTIPEVLQPYMGGLKVMVPTNKKA